MCNVVKQPTQRWKARCVGSFHYCLTSAFAHKLPIVKTKLTLKNNIITAYMRKLQPSTSHRVIIFNSCGFMYTTLLGVSVFEKCRKEEKEAVFGHPLISFKNNWKPVLK